MGFFLSIGMSGHITISALLVALVLAVAVILKVKLLFFIFTRFRLRTRTSVLASLNLANYSEFGLIVGTIAVANGWLSGDWLVIVAMALTLTFIAAAPINARGGAFYAAIESRVKRFQNHTRLPEDATVSVEVSGIYPGPQRRVARGSRCTTQTSSGR